ncbi:MAG: hypothetical protein AVDCRST_MAG52-194, partial [uncultured Blastococcus sp.]
APHRRRTGPPPARHLHDRRPGGPGRERAGGPDGGTRRCLDPTADRGVRQCGRPGRGGAHRSSTRSRSARRHDEPRPRFGGAERRHGGLGLGAPPAARQPGDRAPDRSAQMAPWAGMADDPCRAAGRRGDRPGRVPGDDGGPHRRRSRPVMAGGARRGRRRCRAAARACQSRGTAARARAPGERARHPAFGARCDPRRRSGGVVAGDLGPADLRRSRVAAVRPAGGAVGRPPAGEGGGRLVPARRPGDRVRRPDQVPATTVRPDSGGRAVEGEAQRGPASLVRRALRPSRRRRRRHEPDPARRVEPPRASSAGHRRSAGTRVPRGSSAGGAVARCRRRRRRVAAPRRRRRGHASTAGSSAAGEAGGQV